MAVLKSHFIFTFGANFSQFSDLMQIANICNEREWRSLRGRLHFQRKWNSQRFIHRKWLKLHLNFHSLLRHFSLDLSGKNRITILKVCPKNCLAQLRLNIQMYVVHVRNNGREGGEKRLPQIFLGRTSIPLPPPPKEFWKSSMGFSSLYEMLMGENLVRTCSKHGERSNCLREKWKFEHCKSSVPFGHHNA